MPQSGFSVQSGDRKRSNCWALCVFSINVFVFLPIAGRGVEYERDKFIGDLFAKLVLHGSEHLRRVEVAKCRESLIDRAACVDVVGVFDAHGDGQPCLGSIGVFRDGKNLELTVTLADVQEMQSDEVSSLSESLNGATLANADEGGVEVQNVDPRSPAAALGLEKGDIITGVNRDEVKDIASLKKSLSSAKGNISALRIERDDSVIYITIR